MSSISTRKIATSGLWLTASFALAKISQLVSQVILARLLSPTDFGVWGMVLIITTLSALFKDSAIAAVLVQRGLDDQGLVNAVYSLGVNVSVGMFFIQVLMGLPLAHFFNLPILLPLSAIAAVVFLIGAGAGSHTAILQRQMKFRELAIADSCGGIARLSGAVIAALMGAGVWSFAIAEIGMTIVDSLVKRYFSGYRFNYSFLPDPKAVQEVRGYISSLIGINLAVYANTTADNIIVGKLIGARFLGYYNMAYQLAMLPTFALSQINRISFSVLSQRDNQGQKKYLCQMLELYAILYSGIYGIGFIIAPWIIPSVYGSEWEPTIKLFQIVLIFAYTRGFMSILGTALNAANKPNINAAINWVLVPLSVPAFFVGAYWWGTAGVAFAVALVMGVGASIWFWVAISRVSGWNLKELLQPIILPTVAILISLGMVIHIPMLGVFSNLRVLVQFLLLVSLYSLILSFASQGRIPRLLIDLVQRSFNKK